MVITSKLPLDTQGAWNHITTRLNLGPVYMEGGCPGEPSYPGRATFSYVSIENALKHLNARQGSPPTLGGTAFYLVNGWFWAIPVYRGEISCENIAAQGEFFIITISQCYLLNRLTVNLKRSM